MNDKHEVKGDNRTAVFQPSMNERAYESPEMTHLGPIQNIVLSGATGGGDSQCCFVGHS